MKKYRGRFYCPFVMSKFDTSDVDDFLIKTSQN